MSAFTYDPLRIVTLRQRTLDAVDELSLLQSSDPLAAPALQAVRLMQLNLEGSWLGLIEEIYHSSAMVEWRELDRFDGSADALSRLVDDFGARAERRGRTAATPAADASGSAPFVERARAVLWRRALQDLSDALAGSGSLAQAVRRIELLATSTTTPRVEVLELGDVLELLASLHWVVAHGLLEFDGVDTVRSALAGLLARAIVTEADLEELERAATEDPGLGALVARHHRWFPAATTARMAGAIIASADSAGYEPAMAGSLASLLDVISHSADASVRLLADPVILERLATDTTLDATAIEGVLASAIGGGLDPAATMQPSTPTVESLGVLAGLMTIAGDHRLSTGARRGIARGIGPVLGVLGVHLDRRRPVKVAVDDGTVALGDYSQLADLISQLLDDDAAQLVLGTAIGAYRMDQMEISRTALAGSDGSDSGAATRSIGAALADVTRVLELVGAAQQRHTDTALLDFAMSKRQVQQVTSALGITAALLTGPAGPFVLRASHLISLSAAEVVTALAPDDSEHIGRGLQASAAAQFTAAAVSMVTGPVELRRALGVGHLDDDTVDLLRHHLELLEEDPSDLDALIAIETVMAADPALDTYLETVRAISGEDALG